MATLPEKFARAQGAFGEILRRFNLLRDVVRPWTDVEGKGGIKVTVAEANVVIDAQELARRIDELLPSGAADTCALDLSIDGSGNGVFLPGTINGLTPPLTLSSIPTSGTRYIVLNTTWANAAISGATWSIETTPPPGSAVTQGAPPTSLAILTHVVVNGVPTRVIRCGNILVTPFEAFRTDKTPPLVAGERPWISWYGFQVAP
jgi:hypothetical protein